MTAVCRSIRKHVEVVILTGRGKVRPRREHSLLWQRAYKARLVVAFVGDAAHAPVVFVALVAGHEEVGGSFLNSKLIVRILTLWIQTLYGNFVDWVDRFVRRDDEIFDGSLLAYLRHLASEALLEIHCKVDATTNKR